MGVGSVWSIAENPEKAVRFRGQWLRSTALTRQRRGASFSACLINLSHTHTGVKAKIHLKTEIFIAFEFNNYFMFNYWQIADIQAHSAPPSAALQACRSAIFEKYKKKWKKKEKCMKVFEYFDPILWMSSKCFFYKSSGSKLFHIKDPPPQIKSSWKIYIHSKICTNVNDCSKIADLQACISELEYLLFFNS